MLIQKFPSSSQHIQRVHCVSAQPSSTSYSTSNHQAIKQAKLTLFSTLPARGARLSSLERASIEEQQLELEALGAGPLDFDLLQGKWKLLYTTASDVVPLVRLSSEPSPFLKVGDIFQRFSNPASGTVENVIEATVKVPLLPELDIVFVVSASYEIRTAKSIALTFQSAGIESVKLTNDLQNFLAPALLPRGWWNQLILSALNERNIIEIPLTTRSSSVNSTTQRPRGINYALTYLDEDTLVGRAQGNGGTFIFVREQV
jgi:hypothetical protein